MDRDYHFLSGDIKRAVETALRSADGKDLLVLGADVARRCIEARLIDEILIHIAPILLGSGVRFFGKDRNADGVKGGSDDVQVLGAALELLEQRSAGQIPILRYRVIK